MTPFRFLLGLLVATASFSAGAHDTLGRDWCTDPHVEPTILEEFSFEKQDLIALSGDQNIVPRPADDKCGVVDNRSQWHSAMHISINFCGEYSGWSDDVKAIILEPSSYSVPRHHTVYTFSEGLKGVCVYCPPKKPVGPGPRPRNP
jgi:hypothetical protein